jgi:hypothetical protein
LTEAVSLKEQRERLFNAVVQRYEDGEWWRLVVNLFFVGGGGLLAGLGKLEVIGEPHASWLLGVGLTMVLVGGGLSAWFDFRRKELTKHAKESIDLAQTFLDEKERLKRQIESAHRLDERRRYLIQAIQQMQEAVERMPIEQPLETVVGAMLDAGSSDLEGACGFGAGEKWAFSIFRREQLTSRSNKEVMRRFALSWADRRGEKASSKAREWKKKEGFTGVAWQNDAEVIESDATDPRVAALYPVPSTKQKPDDRDRYVSVAVIPIKVGSNDEMWGAVTATSNVKDRFSRDSTDPAEHNVSVVRMVSQLIAMQVALRNGSFERF